MEDLALKMDGEILWKALQYMSDEEACISFDDYVKNGGDIHYKNDSGATFLHRAANLEKDTCLRKLVELGVAVNDVNAHGVTALYYATHLGVESTIFTLLELGADPKIERRPGYSAFTHVQHFNTQKWQKIYEAFQAVDGTKIETKPAGKRK